MVRGELEVRTLCATRGPTVRWFDRKALGKALSIGEGRGGFD